MTALLRVILWLPVRCAAWIAVKFDRQRADSGGSFGSRSCRQPANIRDWVTTGRDRGFRFGKRDDLDNVRRRLAEADLTPDERADLYAIAVIQATEAAKPKPRFTTIKPLVREPGTANFKEMPAIRVELHPDELGRDSHVLGSANKLLRDI